MQVRLVAPEIDNFQKGCEWKADEAVTIAPRKGWLIYVSPK